MTDYRKQIDLELIKLISYHEKEHAHYVSEGGSTETESSDNLESIEDNAPPYYSSWSSEHFVEKIKPMAMLIRDYDIVGKCEILLAILEKIKKVEEKAIEDSHDDYHYSYRADYKTQLENKRYFSASDIGCYFGYISGQEVNKIMIEAGLQERTNEGLIPTDQGQPYHIKTVYTPAGSKTCRWDKAIVHVLAVHLGTEPGLGV